MKRMIFHQRVCPCIHLNIDLQYAPSVSHATYHRQSMSRGWIECWFLEDGNLLDISRVCHRYCTGLVRTTWNWYINLMFSYWYHKHSSTELYLIDETRTTKTPAFWGYPPPPHDYPYYWPIHTIDQFISDPKSKQGESQKIRKKKIVKSWNFRILL